MKTIFLFAILTTLSIASMAQHTLTIKITDLKQNTGTVHLNLLDAKEKSVQQIKGTVKDGVCTVMLHEIPSGTYAIQYYHDANSNNKMDTGMFGKPEEGYGYSNDARGFMGPADFEDQIFEINSDLQITLKTVN